MPRKVKQIEIHPERFKAAQSAYNEAQTAKASGDLNRMAGALNKLGDILNEPSPNGRPRKQIDQAIFEELCRIQCTLSEVSSVLRCDESTVRRWVKETFEGQTFETVHTKLAEDGKSSLRRAQFKAANNGNPAMLIWLGKQYLKQKDRSELEIIDPQKAASEAYHRLIAEFPKADPERVKMIIANDFGIEPQQLGAIG